MFGLYKAHISIIHLVRKQNFLKKSREAVVQRVSFNNGALSNFTLLKKRFWHMCFPKNFVKFLRTLFDIEHLWWLLL